MEELEPVTFEQAKALKELGFPQDAEDMYALRDKIWDEYCEYNTGDIIYGGYGLSADDIVSAPTLELVAKWLRKYKKIYIDITWGNMQGNIVWCASLNNLGNGNSLLGDIKHVGSYEEALSAGIDKVIEILKVIKTDESGEEHLV